MALILVERRLFAELINLAVDFRAHETRAPHVRQLLAILALAIAHDRREDVNPRALGELHDLIDDLLDALLSDFFSAVVTERVADAREQQSQVVVDLGDGADRRARIARGGFLLDRDRRRQPLDGIDVRLFHLLEELARIGGERFDVAPLPLGIDGVERERGFSRARKTGDHDQAVARNFEIDVLEVVLARTPDYELVRHEPRPRASPPRREL